jgi:apolipoprotein N-acyltransferase
LKKFLSLEWLPPFPVLLLAALSAVLLALAYQPFSIGVLSFVALVPVTTALLGRSDSPGTCFKGGYSFGFIFWLCHMYWMVNLAPGSSITVPWLLVPALVLLAGYLAVYPGLFFMLHARLSRASRLASILVGTSLWFLIALFPSNREMGIPFAAIGYSLSRTPALAQTAAVVGVFGLGAMIVAVNLIWSHAAVARRMTVKLALFLLGATVFAANAFYGERLVESYSDDRETDGSRVAIVQPNVDLELKWQATFTDSTFRLIDRLTREACESGPDIVIFPETAAPVYINHDLAYRQRLADLAAEMGVPIFIGFLDGRYDGPDNELNVYNSSGIFYPEGGLAQYDKTHLLPFGEAIPLAWKFRALRKLTFGQANFQPGSTVEPVPSPIGGLGPLVCFESIFPGISRRFVKQGAGVLVNITNDGWFSGTPGPYQQSDMAILRTVENRRYLLRSANNGVTMVVDPAGRITSSLEQNREAILVEDIVQLYENTIYTRFGDVPAAAVALILLAIGAVVGHRSGGARR